MKKSKGLRVSEIAMCVILFGMIVVPLLGMFLNLNSSAIKQVFINGEFYLALKNTVIASILSTLIAMVIAYILAWAINRTNIKLKVFWSVAIVLPMLIPSISHGSGLILLFGNNGILTKLFSLQGTIYGLSGIVVGSVIYSFPVAFLMISDILKYQDYSPYEAANVLNIPKSRQFAAITLPYLKKPLISVFFATFTMIVTDYGVPLSVGGQFKTLPVLLYEEAVGQLNYSVGSVIGIVLLFPAVIAFLFDLLNKDTSRSATVVKPFAIDKRIGVSILAYVVCGGVVLFTGMIFGSFCVQAFAKRYPNDLSFTVDNFLKTLNKGGAEYLLNSLVIAVFTSIVGVTLAFIVAYFTARIKTKASKFLHLISMTSLAIPGLVLGLSYIMVFKKSFIYGTLSILVMVNTVHFFASPYLMMYNALGKIHKNIEDVGEILGISRWRIIYRVIIPQAKYTLLEMLSYFFVNSMMTISAVSFLADSNTKPLSLLINQFEAYSMMECAAVVALIIFTVNLLVKIIVGVIKRKQKGG